MEGLLFLASCIAIGLLAFWEIRNDLAELGGPTTGLFAMTSEPAPASETEAPKPARLRTRPGRPARSKTLRRQPARLPK